MLVDRDLSGFQQESLENELTSLVSSAVYRTPEQRPPDAEVAELLTRSFSVVEDDKNGKPLESEFTIVVEPKSIALKPRPSMSRDAPFNIQQWTEFLDAEGRVTDPFAVKKLIFKGVSEFKFSRSCSLHS